MGFEYQLELIKYAGIFLTGIAVFFFSKMVLQESEILKAVENLDDRKDVVSTFPFAKFSRPFFTQYILPLVQNYKRFDKYREKYRKQIGSAGLKDEFTPDEFIAFKIFIVFAIPFAIAAMYSICVVAEKFGEEIIPTASFPTIEDAFILGILGSFFPDLQVKRMVGDRHRKIGMSLPFVVDLMCLSMEAGLDFVGSIGKVVEKAKPNPLIEELTNVLKDLRVGSSRAESLKNMAVRIDMPAVNSFVAVLVSADQMGASVGEVLRQQSDQIRVFRMNAAEKAGAAATSKLLIPTLLLIVPAVFLILLAPTLLPLMKDMPQ